MTLVNETKYSFPNNTVLLLMLVYWQIIAGFLEIISVTLYLSNLHVWKIPLCMYLAFTVGKCQHIEYFYIFGYNLGNMF